MSAAFEGETGRRVFGSRLMIRRDDIEDATVDNAAETPTLTDGQALFRIERVALTANNVTYAAAGDFMDYWRFFPVAEGYGGLPVWGYAECIASEASGVKVGERAYGYWPLAEMLLIDVTDVTPRGFNDGAAHREGLSPLYNRYEHVDAEPDTARENVTALFRPLFTTGWLIAQQMRRASNYGAEQVVISSASSKTAMATAWSFRDGEDETPELIGLTSPAHVDFTKRLGLYDQVLTYADLADVGADRPTAYIDFAGNLALRREVHERFGPPLGYSMAVGLTHWTDAQSDADMPPPEAKFFFAPDVMQSETDRRGAKDFRDSLGDAWDRFAEFVAPMVEVQEAAGLPEALPLYQQLARGEVGGATSLIVTQANR